MEPLKITLTTFLRIAAKPARGKVGELRTFMAPGGYDFYKVMKKLARGLATGAITLVEAEQQIDKIKQKPEREHTREAIQRFYAWLLRENPTWLQPPKGAYEAKSGLLVVRLEPELAFEREDGSPIAVQLWNLDKPDLTNELAGEGLRLLVRELAPVHPAGKFQFLNLRTEKPVGEDVIAPASDLQLRLDLLRVETIWEDLHNPALTVDDVVSHVSELKLPPTAPL
jgi:hypothetical protein